MTTTSSTTSGSTAARTGGTVPAPRPAWVDDVVARAGSVPPIPGFPTVDELSGRFHALAAQFPDLVRVRRVGTSRLGEPIECFEVGEQDPGLPVNLVVGGVHPNEPVGACTSLHLARELCTDAALRRDLGAVWHVVPCIDPDGARLNEGWFAGPFERGHYSRHFYRPAPAEQVEWSFPFAHKGCYFDAPTPETLALMRLIDDLRPRLLVALHNGEMGGVYYYVSRALPGLVEALHAVPAALGLPLDLGEPENPVAPVLGDAVFGLPGLGEVLDLLEELGVDPADHQGGTSSAEWAHRHGTFSLVAELPYWSHPAADDTTPTTRTQREVLTAKADALAADGRELTGILAAAEPHLTEPRTGPPTPFLRASRAFVPMFADVARHDRARAADPAAQRPATVAEEFSAADFVRMFRLRYGGMLVRALAAPVAGGLAGPELRRLHRRAADLLEDWQQDAARLRGTQRLDIADLVGVQYGSTLATALALRDEAAEPSAELPAGPS
ncbi:M14 family zinc carboxypeptidase [Kineococcus sp. SYSU DK001]|uniref:M14 family zinc carboxypeptidase n=1 Tax=Kineococcus sp. SYSU DK001 TaxID=3383122 RepID=UPI003D7F01FF